MQSADRRSFFFGAVLSLGFATGSVNTLAAGTTVIPPDSNTRITVENSVVDGDETTVFFYTSPYLGDPNSGKECPLNFYAVTLRPGLPEATAKPVATEVCSGILSKGGLLDNGDALILARDRLERWRDGERLSSESFSSIEATEKLRVTTDDSGGQFYAISPDGNLVLALPGAGSASGNYPGSALVISSLQSDGEQRWERTFTDSIANAGALQLWASKGGGALLRMDTLVEGSMVAESETSLLMISGSGSEKRIGLSEAAAPFDMLSVKTQEDMQKFYEYQDQNQSESIESLNARPRPDGGFDVLFQRESSTGDRNGYFLVQVGSGGDILSETSLGNVLSDHGLDQWIDFYIEDDQLIVLSRVMATQHGVQAKRKKYMQNLVSRVPLDGGAPVSRLLPLDERYLEAAMNAGDEQRQYLPGLPGGEPVMLTRVGNTPLAVSVGFIGGHSTLRITEANDNLTAWNEYHEENQVRLAKKASRGQRKADREASQQQMNADLAASLGVTPEEYNALSNKEQKELMVRKGDPAAMQAMMEKHAAAAQQAMPAQQPGVPQDMNAQIADAMAKAQEQMANDPNMPPEMRAQMAAMMAQMGQAPGGQAAMPPAAAPPPQAQPSQAQPSQTTGQAESPPEDAVMLDANLRGFLEFENLDGLAMTLLIFNKQTGEELLKKEYPDGAIYEYIDFSRFSLPLEQIGVIYRDISNQILAEPALVVEP